MTRPQQRDLNRLNEQIEKAKSRHDFVKVLQLCQQREKLLSERQSEERVSLNKALEGYSRKEKDEATALVIYMVATADILYSATMEVESKFKKRFGLDSIPIIGKLRGIVSELAKIVKTIDDVGSGVFSERYADMATEVETKYKAVMMNYIYSEVMKFSKIET